MNIGSVEMVNPHQNLLTPDFILIGMLEQEASMTVKLIETAYQENKDLSNQILEKLFTDQKFQEVAHIRQEIIETDKTIAEEKILA